MKAQYLIAHDLGTSGNKATAYTTEGDLVYSENFAYDTHYFNGNWAEQDPEDWFRAVVETTNKIVDKLGADSILAMSFSGQMMGCVLVDDKGMHLRPAIIWADQRAEKELEFMAEHFEEEEFYYLTGHRMSPSYSLAKLLWVKNNEAAIYDKTYKMLNAKDYVIGRLTGRFVTDYSDASGTNLLDINALEWSDKIVEAVDIRREILPELLTSTTNLGSISEKIKEFVKLSNKTSIILGGGDGVCAAVGAGCIREGNLYNYLGSSSWIASSTTKPLFDPEMRTFNWAHMVPGMYTPCGTMQSAGGAFSWMKKEMADTMTYDEINDLIKESKPGANGLLFLPYLLGERSPRWNPNAKGAFIGLKMEHGKKDLYRSVMEGVTLNLNLIKEILETLGDWGYGEITVIGGGAKSLVWQQIMADIWGLEVVVPENVEEATSMGAALAAGVGVGVYKDFSAVSKFMEVDLRTKPNSQVMMEYEGVKAVFEKAYQALLPVYEELR